MTRGKLADLFDSLVHIANLDRRLLRDPRVRDVSPAEVCFYSGSADEARFTGAVGKASGMGRPSAAVATAAAVVRTAQPSAIVNFRGFSSLSWLHQPRGVSSWLSHRSGVHGGAAVLKSAARVQTDGARHGRDASFNLRYVSVQTSPVVVGMTAVSGDETEYATSGPLAEFDRRVRSRALVGGDARQAEAMRALQNLYDQLVRDRQRGHFLLADADGAAPASAVARMTHAIAEFVGAPTETRLTAASASSSLLSSSSQGQKMRSKGVYLHGGVGRGKTMLMDMFHSTLPVSLACLTRRTHFHEFMSEVHQRLHAMRKDSTDPLAMVAAMVHAESPVLCFDELELVDVADALVFKRLLEHVFALGGTLVVTSNAAPEELYEGGINRAAFVPFIDTLYERCTVISLDYNDDVDEVVAGAAQSTEGKRSGYEGGGFKGVDYRRCDNRERGMGAHGGDDASSSSDTSSLYARASSSSGVIRPSVACGEASVLVIANDSPDSIAAIRNMWESAEVLSHRCETTASNAEEEEEEAEATAVKEGRERTDAEVPVASGRSVVVPRMRGRCAWFHFDDVCGHRSRLSAADYILLVTRFDVMALTGVPTFSTHNENEARRFINLVDVLYDRRALLIASLAAAPDALFRGDVEGGDDAREKNREDEEGEGRMSNVPVADGVRNVHDPVREAVRQRVRQEGSWGGSMATVSGEGGSSGRSTTMVGGMEWSATGRSGASLADLQRVNFTFRASRRCVSRLVEMGSAAYEAAWIDSNAGHRSLVSDKVTEWRRSIPR